jgi:hypothetical protein
MVVFLGHPGRQILPRLVAVTISVDDEVSRHMGFLLATTTHTRSARRDADRLPEPEQPAEAGHVILAFGTGCPPVVA